MVHPPILGRQVVMDPRTLLVQLELKAGCYGHRVQPAFVPLWSSELRRQATLQAVRQNSLLLVRYWPNDHDKHVEFELHSTAHLDMRNLKN